MNRRMATAVTVLIATLMAGVPIHGQEGSTSPAARIVDPAVGLSLDEAIARALEQEPLLRAARSEVEVAQGLRMQAALRPNPSVSLERREEPAGRDNTIALSVEWPLDLFRRRARVAVADERIATARLAAADRERLLAAEVRARYGDLVAAARDLTLLEQVVSSTRQQAKLLRARVEEGASPPLERDLLEVEMQRLEVERLLQAGAAEAALFALKRLLGMSPDATLAARDTLEDLVGRQSAAAPDGADAAERRADVRETAAGIALADAAIERARAEGRLDMSLFANYMRMDAGFPQRAAAADGRLVPIRGLFHYVSAGLTVTVPVLNRNQGDVAAARAERAGAAAAHDAARLTAQAEIAAARVRDDRAHQAVKVFNGSALALARRNLTVVNQSFELGRVTVFDVLSEQRRYLDVERAYSTALRAAYESRTELNRTMGVLR